ncbi:MAG: RidA family protein [Solirubrobacterales bacterium]
MPTPAGPYSSVVVSDGFIFVCGQIPRDADGNLAGEDFESQARQVFENMRRCLAATGASMSDVVKVNGFLKDWSDAPAFNEVYREYFTEPYPVRSTIPVALGTIRVEVECIARLPRGAGDE